MAAQAGWYKDPSGNKEKLRYWDGNQWTDNFMDAPAAMGAIGQTPALEEPSEAQQSGYQQTGTQQPGCQQSAYQDPNFQNPNYHQTTYYQQPNYGPRTYPGAPQYPNGTYVVDSGDQTLRLIAFIFSAISLVSAVFTALFSFGITAICLAWMIPMTIHCWRIYKGERYNTVAFGVCMLIFVSVVAGILLLVSKKEA